MLIDYFGTLLWKIGRHISFNDTIFTPYYSVPQVIAAKVISTNASVTLVRMGERVWNILMEERATTVDVSALLREPTVPSMPEAATKTRALTMECVLY